MGLSLPLNLRNIEDADQNRNQSRERDQIIGYGQPREAYRSRTGMLLPK
jgi:hypothetical protein